MSGNYPWGKPFDPKNFIPDPQYSMARLRKRANESINNDDEWEMNYGHNGPTTWHRKPKKKTCWGTFCKYIGVGSSRKTHRRSHSRGTRGTRRSRRIRRTRSRR